MATEEAGHDRSSLEDAITGYMATVDAHKTACMQAYVGMQCKSPYPEFEEAFRSALRKHMEKN